MDLAQGIFVSTLVESSTDGGLFTNEDGISLRFSVASYAIRDLEVSIAKILANERGYNNSRVEIPT